MLNEKSKYFPDFRVETSSGNFNWIRGVLKLYDLTVLYGAIPLWVHFTELHCSAVQCIEPTRGWHRIMRFLLYGVQWNLIRKTAILGIFAYSNKVYTSVNFG